MSSIALSGNAGGTGVFTLASPSSSSNYTLTLPAASGTLITALPAGSVLQVVQTVKTDVFSSTSTSLVDITGFSATITPRNSSSRILVMISLTAGSEAANNLVDFVLVRASTQIFLGDARSGYNRASVGGFRGVYDTNGANSFGANFVDSPATASAVTYKLQAKCEGGTFRINTNGSNAGGNVWSFTAASSMILMEIAG